MRVVERAGTGQSAVDRRAVEARRRLGRALAAQGRIDEAREAYRAVLEIDPHDDAATRNLLRLDAAAWSLAAGAPAPPLGDFVAEPSRMAWARLECRDEELGGLAPGSVVELGLDGPVVIARSKGVRVGMVRGPAAFRLARLLGTGARCRARVAALVPDVLLVARIPRSRTGTRPRAGAADLETLLEPFER
jgi:tetratricopeptide (TPR) repeat protein